MKKIVFSLYLTCITMIGVAQDRQSYMDEVDSLIAVQSSYSEDVAMGMMAKSVTLANEVSYYEGAALSLIILGNLKARAGELDTARLVLDQAKKIINEQELIRHKGRLYYQYANRLRKLSKYGEAAVKLDSALLYFPPGDSLMLAEVYNLKGLINKDQENNVEALQEYTKALEIYELLQNDNKLALVYVNMANLYFDQRNTELAKKATFQALKLAKKNNDRSRLGNVYSTLGRMYETEEQYDSSVYYQKLSAENFLAAGNKLGAAITYQNIASTRIFQKKYDQALETARKALRMKQEIGNVRSLLYATLLMGDILNKKGDYSKALEFNLPSLDTARKYRVKDRERVALLYLSDSYEGLGNHKKSLDYYKKYSHLQDSIYNASQSKQLSDLRLQYETEKKEEQIAFQEKELELRSSIIDQKNRSEKFYWITGIVLLLLLGMIGHGFRRQKKLNRILYSQKTVIEQREKEKETLLKEIHHRVKNNLQIISSLLNIQSRSIDNERTRLAIKEGRSRIKSMSLIHEKLYRTENFSRVDMKKYIEELTEFLQKSFRSEARITNEIVVEESELDVNTAIPVGLIVNELITNAYKYAFKGLQEGKVHIQLKKNELGRYVLMVRDNGIGLSSDFQPEKSKSMGLSLVRSLTEQMEGTFEFRSKKGAEFSIEFEEKMVA